MKTRKAEKCGCLANYMCAACVKENSQHKQSDQGSMANHTPTPWFYDEGGYAKGSTIRQSHDQRTRGYIRRVQKDSVGNNRAICRVTGVFGNQDANAAFIVRAVNAHGELVKAANEAKDLLVKLLSNPGHEYVADAYYHLASALAKAKGVVPPTQGSK